MITGINKSKTLTMHISYECKCNLMAKNVFQVNGGITINVDGSVKNITYVTNRKQLSSIMNDSAITFEEIIDTEVKWYDEETNFN